MLLDITAADMLNTYLVDVTTCCGFILRQSPFIRKLNYNYHRQMLLLFPNLPPLCCICSLQGQGQDDRQRLGTQEIHLDRNRSLRLINSMYTQQS